MRDHVCRARKLSAVSREFLYVLRNHVIGAKAVQEQAERGGGKAERRVFLVGRRTLRRNIIKPRLETMVRGGGGVGRCQPRMRKMWMSEILLC